MFSVEIRGVRIDSPYDLEAIQFCKDVLEWRIKLLKNKRGKSIPKESPLPSMFLQKGEEKQ